nr:hypothetical protein [Peribacillus kribbensis]
MGKYGTAAVQAAELLINFTCKTPIDAWNEATTEIFGRGTHSQKKGCPKGAFLGICEAGLLMEYEKKIL